MADEEDAPLTKKQVLQQAIVGREQEVMHYDINITNFQHMIEEIDAGAIEDADLEASNQSFKKELIGRIAAEKRERGKSTLVLNALRRQLGNT